MTDILFTLKDNKIFFFFIITIILFIITIILLFWYSKKFTVHFKLEEKNIDLVFNHTNIESWVIDLEFETLTEIFFYV